MPLNDAHAELKEKLQEGNTGIKLASRPMIPLCRYFYPLCLLRADNKGAEFLTCGRGCPVTRQVSSRVSPSLMV